MKVKTYGIPGLSEWHGKLKVGTIESNVSFVGGTASPSGSQPAYMTTKDPITQFVIENSKEYKDGFIILMLTQEMAGVHPRMAVPKPLVENTNPAPEVPGNAKSPKAAKANVENQDAGVQPPASSEEVEGKDESTQVPDEGSEGAPEETKQVEGVTIINVPDRHEAVEYLKEHYPEKGYNGNNLRSKEAFAAACDECGVQFNIANA